MRFTIKLFFPLFLLLFLISCNKGKTEHKKEIKPVETQNPLFDSLPFYDAALSSEERIRDLISRLTLEEKAQQMMHNTPAIERLGIPPYSWWNEALHGVGRSGIATVFPQAIGIGATFDEDLAFKVSSAISDEARAMHNAAAEKRYYKQYGGLTFWTPNINIFRDPRWGRGQETYGEDPYLTSKIGVAFVKGLQGDNPKYLKTAACAKHFAVHSGPEKLRHQFNAVASAKDMWETYLPAFEALVEADVEAVMCAYNSTNGEPCCANNYLITDVLRNKWNFEGHILSDCWALEDFFEQEKGHAVVKTQAEAAALALKSGVSLNCGSTYYPGLVKAVEENLVTEKEIDEQLAILLKTRFKLGLFDKKEDNPYNNISIEVVNSEKHRALAREVAQKGIVLLKNNGVLPLKNDLSKYFITGPNAANTDILLGNYYGVNPKMVTILEGIAGAIDPASQLQYRMGAMLDRDPVNPMDYATGNARNSDVTIAVLGISSLLEGEEGESLASATAGDRLDYNLPQNQIKYLQKLRNSAGDRPIVAIITGGSPMNLAEVHELADAVLLAWYPGEEGGNAVADVLFGKISPSGRLPITFPKSLDQLPDYEDYSMKGRTYKYMKAAPLYPFGYGLSYTSFRYDTPVLSSMQIKKGDTVTVAVKVTNSGKIKSDEVVQMYLSDTQASVEVPLSQLYGIKRITLEPGASKEVSFTILPQMMKLVNNEGEKVLEAGEFKVFVGGTSPGQRSVDLGLSKPVEATFNIQ
ncbi:glycoside hydrolase family 3 C-terminal domain-containing protein [Abyssalbus ytuae]|uniref:Glycoside hydrolase family 3 C-terminal domain-containing protein n=1 Tax=Abyssalbus ytuae TaxID=2926907 RepID=A0A9E6ZNF6_9FLAO|nr:glycoside hydrolase family 3 C-terminal domain-containing protein [Abyssalbus ytuae]UOB19097.1 glycoside hydrolase family 3 C-terminal domain-containing protein [Abyssalbus ytuae]